MSVYQKILYLLLEESQKIDVPSEKMIRQGLRLKNKEGFEYTVDKVLKDEKTGKCKFLISSKGHKEIITYEDIKRDYERT